MIDLTIVEAQRKKNIARCREKGIILPTYAQMRDPGKIPQSVKDELAANTARCVERGAFGAPTFFVDDEIYFGKNTLRDVEAAIVARRK